MHLDTVIPNFLIQEVPNGRNPERKKLIKDFEENPIGGYLEVPKGPGWGVELNEEFIKTLSEKPQAKGSGAFDEDGAILDL